MWEIFSLGALPFAELSTNDVITTVLSGQRLAKPESCPDSLYALMMECWKEDPEKRPSFKVICEQLSNEMFVSNQPQSTTFQGPNPAEYTAYN
jgi:hypothetical protein